ncbi:MAG: hypothetical protein KF805_05890 [Phycisphaeraceae bacterium]|nr:hypothetical protein [Phycisphaeraceae bacterium]
MISGRAIGLVLSSVAMCALAFGQPSSRTPPKAVQKPGQKTGQGGVTSAGPKAPDKPKRPRTSEDDINDAVEALRTSLPTAEELVLKGDYDAADKLLLSLFPEDTRTPAQSLVLGQAMFANNRQLSYDLVKVAGEQMPESATAQLEWAMAQHRAREYEGALRAYEKANELRPGNSPLLGVAAECALRIGNIPRALELWKLCGEAPRGSQADFEALVCEVNKREDPLAKRRALVKKVAAADENAAIELILLDSEWPSDWWSSGPNRPYLESDMALAGKWILPGGNPQVQEARSVGALAMMDRPSKAKVTDLLRRSRYLIDDDATMPANQRAMVQLLKYAIRSGAISREDARATLGPRILELAKTAQDSDVFEAAGFLYLDTSKQDEVDKLGWEVAKDPRGAASLLTSMLKRKELKWESPELQKAMKEFPENATIARIALELGTQAGQPKQDLIVRALLAEYSGFSILERDGVARPRADAIQAYWAMLAEKKAP